MATFDVRSRSLERSLPGVGAEFVEGLVDGSSVRVEDVAVPDTDAPYAVVIDSLTERPEVADVNTSVVYEHLRSQVVEPLRHR
jgi:hypothetical protein